MWGLGAAVVPPAPHNKNTKKPSVQKPFQEKSKIKYHVRIYLEARRFRKRRAREVI